MKGSPMLRALLMAATLLLLLIPLRRLTAPRVVAAPDVVTKAPERPPESTRVTLSSTVAPFTFEISHLGDAVWKGASAAKVASRDLPLETSREGIDLVIRAGWDTAGPAALKVAVKFPGAAPAEQILWGETGIDEVLTFR